MPELPDLETYLHALRPRVVGQPLKQTRLKSPFLVRSVSPSLADLHGKEVIGLRRLGKRLVFAFQAEHFLVLHLMIAGRLHWKPAGAKLPGRVGLAAFDFPSGTLLLTEAGTRRRASLHVVRGEEELARHDPGGVEPLQADEAAFTAALTREVHTLKRTLTDPRLFAGIGNAYSDEILHRAKLSPLARSSRLNVEQRRRLHAAIQEVLTEWLDRFAAQTGDGFPEKVTAFRPEMAVHGKFGQPCPACGTAVQRIVYRENECNYCPRCQTGGKLLADRSLSRLLHADWPKTIEEWEAE